MPDDTQQSRSHPINISPTIAAENNATRLRANPTPPERVLWSRLRNRQLGGHKFRRQHPLGPFVADFYCAEVGLVIEVDGCSHALRRSHDQSRDRWMTNRNLTVLRFTAGELAKNEDAVLSRILRTARDLSQAEAQEIE